MSYLRGTSPSLVYPKINAINFSGARGGVIQGLWAIFTVRYVKYTNEMFMAYSWYSIVHEKSTRFSAIDTTNDIILKYMKHTSCRSFMDTITFISVFYPHLQMTPHL